MMLLVRAFLYLSLALALLAYANYLEPIVLLPTAPSWAVVLFYAIMQVPMILIAAGMEGQAYERKQK